MNGHSVDRGQWTGSNFRRSTTSFIATSGSSSGPGFSSRSRKWREPGVLDRQIWLEAGESGWAASPQSDIIVPYNRRLGSAKQKAKWLPVEECSMAKLWQTEIQG